VRSVAKTWIRLGIGLLKTTKIEVRVSWGTRQMGKGRVGLPKGG
jgi:hypothetical protein